MSNIVIATPKLSDAATLYPGSQVGTMPAVNLQKVQPSDVWRFTDWSKGYIELDLGSAQSINLMALLYSNASSTAKVRWRGADTQADLTASPGYDSSLLSHWPGSVDLSDWDWTHHVNWLPSAGQTYRWWRVDVSDTTAPEFYQAGRLYLANAWQPTMNIQVGWRLGFFGQGPKGRAIGNQTYPLDRALMRRIEVTLAFQSEDDLYDNAFDIDRLRNNSKDLLVIRDPTATKHIHRQMVAGLMEGLEPITNSDLDIYEKSYTVEELIP